jgi:magnesium-transporting ATPase (P-type)
VGVGTVVLGAPDVLSAAGVAIPADLAGRIAERQRRRDRVVLVALAPSALHEESLPADLRAAGAVTLHEGLRPEAVDAVGYLSSQGVEAKVISGDGLATVQAVASAAGVPNAERGVSGADIPREEPGLGDLAVASGVMARVTPEQKEDLVEAMTARGRYVAMVGDGVNDVLALRKARLAIAMGNGSQMAKGVADLVLLTDSFATVPVAVELGRRIIRNTHRVAKLFVTKSVAGATYLATLGLAPIAFPFLARQQTVIGTLSIGIPAFFLALAPSRGPVRREGFLQSLLGFAVPAGIVIAAAVMAGYLLTVGPLDEGTTSGRTAATVSATVLGLVVLLLVERGPEGRPIRAWVWLMTAGFLGLLGLALVIPWLSEFFALSSPTLWTWGAIGLSVAAGAIGLSTIRRIPWLARLEARGMLGPANAPPPAGIR